MRRPQRDSDRGHCDHGQRRAAGDGHPMPPLPSPRAGVNAVEGVGVRRNRQGARVQDVAQPTVEVVVRKIAAHRRTSPSANAPESLRSDASARDAWLFTVPTDEPITAAICASDMSS